MISVFCDQRYYVSFFQSLLISLLIFIFTWSPITYTALFSYNYEFGSEIQIYLKATVLKPIAKPHNNKKKKSLSLMIEIAYILQSPTKILPSLLSSYIYTPAILKAQLP